MLKRAVVMVVGFLAVAAAIGFVVTRPGLGGTEASDGGGGSGSPASRALATMAPAPATIKGAIGEAASEATVSDQAATMPAVGAVTAELPGLPPVGEAVVKTADLTVEVRKGTFQDSFGRASLVAGRYGGYVQSSSVTGAKAKSGSLTIRVPSARFDDAMADLRDLGTVRGETVQGQVVTEQFIDLQARLRTWQMQEAVLLRLMRNSTTIDQTLRVQRELQDVQFRIEQIKGQLRVLEDQTSMATIHMGMVETGAPIVVQPPKPSAHPSLAEAWRKALDGLLGVAYVTIVGLGYLVPIAALGLVVWFGYRRFTRREEVAAPAA
jgi:hypothetical protein